MTVYILTTWINGEEPRRHVYNTYDQAYVMGSEWAKEDLDRRSFSIAEAEYDE